MPCNFQSSVFRRHMIATFMKDLKVMIELTTLGCCFETSCASQLETHARSDSSLECTEAMSLQRSTFTRRTSRCTLLDECLHCRRWQPTSIWTVDKCRNEFDAIAFRVQRESARTPYQCSFPFWVVSTRLHHHTRQISLSMQVQVDESELDHHQVKSNLCIWGFNNWRNFHQSKWIELCSSLELWRSNRTHVDSKQHRLY